MEKVELTHACCKSGCGGTLAILDDSHAECLYCGNLYFVTNMDEFMRIDECGDREGPYSPYFLDSNRYCRRCSWYGWRGKGEWCKRWDQGTDQYMTCDRFEDKYQDDYFYKEGYEGGERVRDYPYGTVYPADNDYDTVHLLGDGAGSEPHQCGPACRHYQDGKCALVDWWDVGPHVLCSDFKSDSLIPIYGYCSKCIHFKFHHWWHGDNWCVKWGSARRPGEIGCQHWKEKNGNN